MSGYVLGFDEIDGTRIAVVGGKAAHLGELARIDGIRVPAGICVTTEAYRRILAELPASDVERLGRLAPNDRDAIRALSAEIRRTIEGVAIPDDVAAAVASAVAQLGERGAYAVRSSATAEDLPTASFAGQQDTYLNVVGTAAVLAHVRRCWGSLFTERAVTYRLRNAFDHRKVHMAVVVQRMVPSQVAGVLFTADPVTGNRKVVSIDASFGLGEALVSGLVNADVYKVRDGAIVERRITKKSLSIDAEPAGGTRERAIGPERQGEPALTDEQVVRLAGIGRRIEAHFARPQDIEWCLLDDEFHIVQSRPITTLFPIPAAADAENRVYISVGHQQMMTDAMRPLGLSFYQLITPAPIRDAGGRLFVDVTQRLAAPASRAALIALAGKSDPLIGDALESVVARDDFIRPLPDTPGAAPLLGHAGGAPAPLDADPAIAAGLIERAQASIAALKRDIRGKSGPALFEFIREDLQELKRVLTDPLGFRAIMAGMEGTWWLNDHLLEWLGEKGAADTLIQSVPNNITSEMGLELLDVADVIRAHREVAAFLRQTDHEGFVDELAALEGGPEVQRAIRAFLEKHGMRCVGEIDITRPRFAERPTTLLPLLLGNVDHFEPGEAARRFERGLEAAKEKEKEVLGRLRALPDGESKAEETKRTIDRVRTFAGYREFPKYAYVSRFGIYKQALLEEGERLARAGVLGDEEDIFYLSFDELHDVARTNQADRQLIRRRREAFVSYQALTPPRVLTSDGEGISGSYRRDDVAEGALVGLAVSAGIVEGRARVVSDMAEADFEEGDILVTAFTDPSWTPAFVAIKGLVTEVGGLMTHGAVIAREYGLPAVVGVEHATRLIRDGQRIRVNGTDGHVELL
jgi:phosphoenolpyruvate synthase/pyruvate phosphate dikinase